MCFNTQTLVHVVICLTLDFFFNSHIRFIIKHSTYSTQTVCDTVWIVGSSCFVHGLRFLCGSAVAGCNSSTLKPLSGDSSKCLWCGSLDSLQLFLLVHSPFPCFLSFFGSHIYTQTLIHSLSDKEKLSQPHWAVVNTHTCDHCVGQNIPIIYKIIDIKVHEWTVLLLRFATNINVLWNIGIFLERI